MFVERNGGNEKYIWCTKLKIKLRFPSILWIIWKSNKHFLPSWYAHDKRDKDKKICKNLNIFVNCHIKDLKFLNKIHIYFLCLIYQIKNNICFVNHRNSIYIFEIFTLVKIHFTSPTKTTKDLSRILTSIFNITK